MKKRSILIVVSAVLLATISGAAIYLNSLLPIITGYAAKNLASALFIAGRNQTEVEESDLNFSFIKLNKNSVNWVEMSVTSSFLWGKSTAIYRDGFGVTLLRDVEKEELDSDNFPNGTEPGYLQDTIAWPSGDILADSVTGINKEILEQVTDSLVYGKQYGGNCYAFMVLHKGIPVAEAYDSIFNAKTRFLSWSMAKSVTNALVGILVGDGRMDISKPADMVDWQNDSRSTITLNNLMQMQSGLEWNEDYGNRSDVTVMLHCEEDMAKFAYSQKMEFEPGTNWYYSSGTTNIITHLIRKSIGNDEEFLKFPYKRLFNRIGMTDAVFETDPSGNFVGSSYLYATTRDYARFGLLYMNDGMWEGQRILPEGWVDYSRAPASASEGEYGALFWLNECGKLPNAPKDMYMCVGHDGQRIFLLPSQELVIVILGYSPSGTMDFDSIIKDILLAI